MTFSLPITVRNEKMMHKAIIKFMTVALKGYSTTLEEDQYYIKQKKLDQNSHNAIKYRMTEKVVCKDMIKQSEKVLEVLDLSPEKATEKSKELPSLKNYFDYVLPMMRREVKNANRKETKKAVKEAVEPSEWEVPVEKEKDCTCVLF